MGRINTKRICYSVQNLETEVTKKTKLFYKVPKLEEDDSCEIRYVVKFEEHPFMNSRFVTGEGEQVYGGTGTWQFEKEYYTQGKFWVGSGSDFDIEEKDKDLEE